MPKQQQNADPTKNDEFGSAGRETVSHFADRLRIAPRYSAKSMPISRYQRLRYSNMPGSGVSGGSIQ